MEIQFGKQIETSAIDENGSFIISEVTLHDFTPVDNRVQVEQRFKVDSEQEELTSYLKFRDKTRAMRNAEFRIEHTAKANQEGSYYVVWCYTIRRAT